MTPVLESISPAGNCPEAMLQVYGEVPPRAVRLAEYALPFVAPGSEVVVTDKVVGGSALLEPHEHA